jgi:hypothetical protein
MAVCHFIVHFQPASANVLRSRDAKLFLSCDKGAYSETQPVTYGKNGLMTKTKLSMATVISGVAIIGIITPASATTIIRHPGNVVHQQLYDSAGKPVNRLSARALGGTPSKVLCRYDQGTNRCTRI